MNTKTQVLIDMARQHVENRAGNQAMAAQSLTDAEAYESAGEYTYAATRALESLKHSIGVKHSDYEFAIALLND